MGYQQDSVYSFWKVDDFFTGQLSRLNYLQEIVSFKLHTENDASGKPINSLEVVTKDAFDGKERVLEIEFWSPSVFRVRFFPGYTKWEQYPRTRSRAIVRNKRPRSDWLKFTEDKKTNSGVLTTPKLEIRIDSFKKREGKKKVRIHTYWLDNDKKVPLHTTSYLSFESNGPDDFHVVQSVYKPPEARYIGFGEQGATHLVKNEEQVTYFNYDNMRYKQVYGKGPLESKEPMYHSEPFFIEFNGNTNHNQLYGIFIDNPGQVLIDIGYMHSEHIMYATRFGGLDYYVMAAEHPRDVTTQYSHLIGTAKLKPRYCLGYHQGCYGYDTRDKVIGAAEDHRRFDIPLDGIHIDVDIQQQYKTFTIDREGNFKDPEGMFGYLRQLGVKCSTNITPIVSNKNAANYSTYNEGIANNAFVLETRDPHQVWDTYQDFPSNSPVADKNVIKGQPYIGEVYYGGDRGSTGHYPNFADRKVQDWWGLQYTELFKAGLEFVWQDMTTPAIRPTRGDMRSFPFRLKLDSNWLRDKIDQQDAIKIWNLYSYNLHHATYRGIRSLPGRENIRPFIIGRGAFAGVHRYAGLWNGDNSSSWDFFKMNIHQCLALGICSMSVNGQDIGGFEPEGDNDTWADPQLLARWTAAGAFLPWFRNHYNAKASKQFQEPYKFNFIDLDAANVPQNYRHFYQAVYPVAKYYIKLRYRLLQVFYDALFENQYNGLPISRALILNDHDKQLFNDKARFLSDEFFVREDLLVCPLVEPEVFNTATQQWEGKRDIYFPTSNQWYQFMDNKQKLQRPFRGGTTYHGYDASISTNDQHIPFVVPIFVRAGAILPTLEQENFVGELNSKNLPNTITFNIYPDAYRNMYYKLYLDDGRSRDSAPDGKDVVGRPKDTIPVETEYYDYDSGQVLDQNQLFPQNPDKKAAGKFRRTLITHHNYLEDQLEKKKIVVEFNREHDNYVPLEKYFFVALLGKHFENDVIESIQIAAGAPGAAGVAIPRISDPNPSVAANNVLASNTNAWYYNPDINITFVKVFDDKPHITITANKKAV